MADTPGGVVVTGCSSGIGRACALALQKAGFRVFAAVRKQKDAAALREAGLTPILLDLTREELIASAVKTVEAAVGDAGLFGLVNNAGVGFIGPLECLPLEQMREELEINVVGQLAVTQAFLPLLRRARGRIVNIGSLAGRVALPFGGAIATSKHALEAMNDTLRMELAPWGVHVVMVRPGLIKTEAVEKALPIAEKTLAALPPDGKRYYGEMLRKFIDIFVTNNRAGSPPEVIASLVVKALTASRPSSHYSGGKEAFSGLAASATLPTNVLDRVRKKFAGIPTGFGSLNG